MEMYNYYVAVADDVREYISNEINLDEWCGNRDGLEDKLNDDWWVNNIVTGKASGSYYNNTWKAEEAVCHNFDLLSEALDEFDRSAADILKEGAELADVAIRCYVLNAAISEALDVLEDEGAFDKDKSEDWFYCE